MTGRGDLTSSCDRLNECQGRFHELLCVGDDGSVSVMAGGAVF